jgi:hypothetical protein
VQNLFSIQKCKDKDIKIIILPVVLYGCGTWSLTLRKKCRLRIFENRVLRKIFGPNRDEATEEWRKLRKEELYALYFSPSIIRVIIPRRLRWARQVARMGEDRCVQDFGGKT